MSLLSLHSINIKYLYLTPSSTSQITILLNESKVEELTGWLTVNKGEIVRVDKPRGQSAGDLNLTARTQVFFTRSEDILYSKEKNIHKSNHNDIFGTFLVKFYCF